MNGAEPASGSGFEVRAAGPGELAECMAVRRAVFIEGQSIPEPLEVDGLDDQAVHFIARRPGGSAVGTARLRGAGEDGKVERVAVLEAERRSGLGRALMREVERAARGAGHRRLVLSAQESAIGFYDRLGYCREGERYLEAGIPHLRMFKAL